MGRPKKAPPIEELPNRLAEGTESPTLAAVVAETDDDIIVRMNAESRARQAVEEPILEPGAVAEHSDFLPGMAPVHFPELDTLATARHQAMQARQLASQKEKDSNTALLEKMHTLKRTAYTSIDGLIVTVVKGKEKVTTEHDSGKPTKEAPDGISNDWTAEQDLDESEDEGE